MQIHEYVNKQMSNTGMNYECPGTAILQLPGEGTRLLSSLPCGQGTGLRGTSDKGVGGGRERENKRFRECFCEYHCGTMKDENMWSPSMISLSPTGKC